MHIGIDARLYYYRQAGIGLYAARLIRALAELATPERFTVLQSRKAQDQIVTAPRFRCRGLWTPCHHHLEQLTLPLEIAFARLDVLHSPDFIPPFRRNCRSVITVHDLAFLLFPGLLTGESESYYGQIRRAVDSAEGIIAVSESTRRDMQELLGVPPERVTVIHHAADACFRPLSDRQAVATFLTDKALPQEFILFVGTVEPRKNLAALLRAYSLLLHEGEPIKALTSAPDTQKPKQTEGLPKLLIAGARGWLTDEVYRIVEERKLSEQVVFLESVTPYDLVFLYNAALLFVFPSLYEGFGFPLLEAMACGTPVVAANVSSIPEVVGDAALTFDPRDETAIAATIWQGLTDQALRQRLQEAGLRRAAEFSWRRTAENTLAVYRRAGSGR